MTKEELIGCSFEVVSNPGKKYDITDERTKDDKFRVTVAWSKENGHTYDGSVTYGVEVVNDFVKRESWVLISNIERNNYSIF